MTGATDVSPRDRLFGLKKALWPGLWIGLLLTVFALSLGACDLGPGTAPGEEDGPDSLKIDLLESGQVVRGFEGEGPLRTRAVRPLERRGKQKAGSQLKGEYACTISLYRPSGPRGAGYYHRSATLTYPDSVRAEAEGETKTLRSRIGGDAVPHASNTNTLLRCQLPAVEGAERRVRRFFRAGPGQLKATGFERVDSAKVADWEGKIGGVRRKGTCWFQRTCSKGPNGELHDCTDWQFDGCTGGGAGEGGGFTPGDLPSGDQPCSGDPCPLPTIAPGDVSGGPTDEPDPVNEQELCPGDPLKDMDIRPTCDGIEGGRFGETRGPNNEENHWGLDLGGSDAEIGTEISAVEGGTVVRAADGPQADKDGWGNFVIINSGQEWYLYAHLSEIITETGGIDEGDKIGEMGESGNADDAKCNPVHLHLEVREGDQWPSDDTSKRKDPEKYVGTEFNEEGDPISDNCSSASKNV